MCVGVLDIPLVPSTAAIGIQKPDSSPIEGLMRQFIDNIIINVSSAIISGDGVLRNLNDLLTSKDT